MAPAPACRPTRRAVLLAGPAFAGLAALASCTSGSTDATPSPAPVDPDDALRFDAVAREQALLRAYDGAVAAAPSLGSWLLPVRAEHVAHLAALGSPVAPETSSPGARSPANSPAATGLPSAAAAAPPPNAPATAQAQLALLRAAERLAAAGHTAAVGRASRRLAVVLATLAASEASHEVALA